MPQQKLKYKIQSEIEWARHCQVSDSDILQILSDIQTELYGQVKLYEHHNGDVPPRLAHPEPKNLCGND